MARRIPLYEYLYLFLVGGLLYSLLEILFRGHTHWTMTLLGGLSGMVLYWISADRACPIFFQALAGAMLITALEMVTGVFANLIFGWMVWDYSGMPLHLFGQICLPFTLLWMLLSFPALWLCRKIRTRFALGTGIIP
ncbi:MAG: hypothetical protein IJ496_00885 [Ruminococcus sp.]|nr:hypothetical protein [Ruminococcus sp.]